MKLYYGSNMKVDNPKILESKRSLDFGEGFYLTSDLEQTECWAKSTVIRGGEGIASVSVFEYNDDNNLLVNLFILSKTD